MRSVKSHAWPRAATRGQEPSPRQDRPRGESPAPTDSERTVEADGLMDIADVRMLLREIRLRDARRRAGQR